MTEKQKKKKDEEFHFAALPKRQLCLQRPKSPRQPLFLTPLHPALGVVGGGGAGPGCGLVGICFNTLSPLGGKPRALEGHSGPGGPGCLWNSKGQ